MVPSVRTARVEIAGKSRRLDEVYDLVLTYDYESLKPLLPRVQCSLSGGLQPLVY